MKQFLLGIACGIVLLLATASCSSRPSPYIALEPYLKAWEEARYSDMYDLLSARSQASIPRDRFIQRYAAITEGSTILAIKTVFSVDEKLAKADRAVALPFSVTMATSRLGEIREENALPVVFENDRWYVDWSPALIFRDLGGDNRVLFEPEEPTRGSILDRRGRPLAATGKVVTVGVVPGQVEDEPRLLAALEQELKLPANETRRAYAGQNPDWFIPLRDLSVAQTAATRGKLEPIPGIAFREKPARVYPAGATAAHVVGYVNRITEPELRARAARGYGESDVVGREGIEASAEDILAGEKGGKLSIVSPQGDVLKVIAQKRARNGQDVHLTLDLEVQKLAEDSLGSQPGSVVVLSVPDNAVLALATYPRFDPNGFVLGLSEAEYKRMSEDPQRPFQDRPVASAYPIGSVFKVVTMAAGMEKGGFTPSSPFDCDGRWRGLGDQAIMGDWLAGGHGHLDLLRGLVESCNIVFYEVGKKLDSLDPGLLPEFARGFGYGQPTGLAGLEEAPGLVPDPAWKRATLGGVWSPGDGVNLAIGQGYFLATPLQVANAYAAIARGGTLLTPLLVARRGLDVLQSRQKGTLPLSAPTLETIRQGMRGVISDPRGTAAYAFRGSSLSVAAKTGSAETGTAGPQGSNSHAWFAAFAPADRPQVALVVMVEEKGLGSEVAAPIGRKILEGTVRP